MNDTTVTTSQVDENISFPSGILGIFVSTYVLYRGRQKRINLKILVYFPVFFLSMKIFKATKKSKMSPSGTRPLKTTIFSVVEMSSLVT